MQSWKRKSKPLTLRRAVGCFAWMLTATAFLPHLRAQNTPLISGGAAFFSNTNGGDTTYLPIIEPLVAVPLGKQVLIESRAALLESFFPTGSGYDTSHFVGLTYLQADVVASRHLTVVGGLYLIPFNTYNERLSPVWISNFQDGPLIAGVGTLGSGSGLGGMVRGNAVARKNYTIDYAYFYSVRSANEQFSAQHATGGRASLYLPAARLEMGLSYDRVLQGTHENFYGAHLWWEPANTAFRLRSEFARGHHAQGYWLEADYRTTAFGGLNSAIGRFEPVFRMQQTFRRDTVVSDSLPLKNTQRADFGLNYNLPHEVRILTSYARQFADGAGRNGNHNIWETGLVYRFLFPAWKGK